MTAYDYENIDPRDPDQLRYLLKNTSQGQWVADNDEGYGTWGIWENMTPSGNGKPGLKIAIVPGDSPITDANAKLIELAPQLAAIVIDLFACLEERDCSGGGGGTGC